MASSQLTNVIMYLRKSREDIEREKLTGEDILSAHRALLTERLSNLGVGFIERPELESGDTVASRPVFQRVLEVDIPSGLYNAIAVTEVSRLGRGDMMDAGRIYNTIVQFKISIITPHKIYDPTNSADLRQLRFELFLSREEFELINERLRNGREYRARQGYAANNIVTLGFDQNRGKVTINQEEAVIVREIFEMRANNHSYQEIADVMNDRGLITKKGTKYHQSTIRRILHNPRYIGKSRWKGEEYEAKHPPIISMELWNKVHQEINPERSVKAELPPRDNVYLVELYCHECGNRMYGEIVQSHKRNKQGVLKKYAPHRYYVCIGRKKATPKCNHKVRIEQVHDWVFNQLLEITQNQELMETLAEQRNSKLGLGTSTLESDLSTLQGQLKKKNDFLKKLDKDYEAGELPAPLYSKHFDKTTGEINALEVRVRKIKRDLANNMIDIESPEKIIGMLNEILGQWEGLSNRVRKTIIKSFLPRVEIDKQNDFHVSLSLPMSLSAE